MTIKWQSERLDFECIVLVGDIGGTNADLGLVGITGREYNILAKMRCPSSKIEGLLDPVLHFLDVAEKTDSKLIPQICCISAAGPVKDNFCQLTNCKWGVDGGLIEQATGIETIVINDFLAIGYGIPIFDVNDSKRIVKVPHRDGSYAPDGHGVKLVLGPGTGLGVGYLVPIGEDYIPFPSEGGHSDFAPYDRETRDIYDYMYERAGGKPGAELFISGGGINSIYHYLRGENPHFYDEYLMKIDAVADDLRPALIERYSGVNQICEKTIRLFMGMLGSLAGSLCSIFLPSGGVYIAGGMVARNEYLILNNESFIERFESNYRPSITKILKRTPVYIIKDYDISLYGAANAAVRLAAGAKCSVT